MFLELALFFLLVLMLIIVMDRKPPNMPPGPMEIPILGGSQVTDETEAGPLRKKYGDIVTVRTGSLRTVILYDYKTSKQVMARLDMTGRPATFQIFSLDDQKTGGISASVGLEWQLHRRFVLKSLRNLGMGKSHLEQLINIEAQALVDDLKKYNGEAIVYPTSFRTAALNVIWQMVASRRYDLRSEEMQSIYMANKEIQSTGTKMLTLPYFFPFLQKLPRLIRKLLFREHITDTFNEIKKAILTKTITEHEKDFDIDNPRDMIDEYLKDMKEQENDEDTFFRKGALLQTANDMFDAGSETINSIVKWVAYLLAKHPDIMVKLQEEIDQVVPRDKLVSLTDKPNLPYLDAFIVETLRYSSILPLNDQHVATVDTTIEGYNIPKGTMVVTSIYTIHNDPNYWKDPEIFSPDRFIDENGKFRAPEEGFVAFSSGRRQCPAELLARMEVFLFAAAITQNFDVKVPEGVQMTDKMTYNLGFRIPANDTFIYKPRS